jgi:malate permease and related proteins
MTTVITQMAALILCGVLWRRFRPGGLEGDATRRVLTSAVYYLFLPALVLKVLWGAPLGMSSVLIAAVAAAGVFFSMLASWTICRSCGHEKRVTGAVILAAAFPNATYMGLPVLKSIFGEAGGSIAIQYDLFACTPLLLTVGTLVSRHFGHAEHKGNVFTELLFVPPLWAAVLAVVLNALEVPFPVWLDGWLGMLGATVVPLMLFSLGLGLRMDTWRPSFIPVLVPIILLQLMVTPALVWFLGHALGLRGMHLTGAVLEAAMPSMVLGIVFCDRYRLDTGLYAAAVTITTALSLFTLPLWFDWLS